MSLSSYEQFLSSPQTKTETSIFNGIWLKWDTLSQSEKLVCANIVLLPAWWLVGIMQYMPILNLLGILGYDYFKEGSIRLKFPSFVVIAYTLFIGVIQLEDICLFFNLHPFVSIPRSVATSPAKILQSSLLSLSLPGLLWYIQSNNIRVRLPVVAWACSVSALQLFIFGLLIKTVLAGQCYGNPYRNLYGVLTGKKVNYINGFGAGNYLIFCKGTDVRFFFDQKQHLGAYLGFLALMSFEIRQRFWSLSLLAITCCLVVMSGSRTIFLAIPVAIILRVALSIAQSKRAWILPLIITLLSLTFLMPPITNQLFNTIDNGATSVGNIRKESTETRAGIYRETIRRIPDNPIFGHRLNDLIDRGGFQSQAEIGVDYPIGSHSFILGDLLYSRGLFGTFLYLLFFIPLLGWLASTSAERCPLCFPLLALFALMAIISPINDIMILTALISFTIPRDKSRTHTLDV